MLLLVSDSLCSSVLLFELSDWSSLEGGGEWAVGVAWFRGRGS